MDLIDQIREASEPRESKADIIEYYQWKYKGRGANSWKQRLVHDLSNITGMKPKNLEKRFDPQRRDNPEPRNAKQYRELGDSLPPRPPENGYHVSGTVWVKYSEDCEEREIDEDITGEDARQFAELASFQAVANYYQTGDIDTRGPSPCNAESWEIFISAIE